MYCNSRELSERLRRMPLSLSKAAAAAVIGVTESVTRSVTKSVTRSGGVTHGGPCAWGTTMTGGASWHS
jgi:hypothetical protein